MKGSIKHKRLEQRPRILIGTTGVLITTGAICFAQNRAKQPHEMERAHIHNSDMSCCAPCAPETNQDPDVFKRPCFARALGRARIGFRAYHALTATSAVEVWVPEDRLPRESVYAFESLLATVLQPGYLPRAWDEVEFYVPRPMRTVAEMRGDVRMLVGHEVHHGPHGNELKDDEPIQTAWAVGSIEVLPLSWHRIPPSRSALVRLRLHGDARLALRRPPPDFRPGGDRMNERWDFFDRAAFHALLTKVFGVPFESADDYSIRGYDTEITAGVRVFTGKIRSRDRVTQLKAERWAEPRHWWDEMRLLVTDSDPQYFCVQITLREDDKLEAP